MSLYRGLTYNPNYLGILLLVALPLPLWISVQKDRSKRLRRLAIVILFFLFLMLLQTVSRASILSASIILLFFFLGRGASRFTVISALSILAAIMVMLLAPQLVDELFFRFFQKGNLEVSVLYSREVLFAESLEAAHAGGLFGLGHGVSYGFTEYSFGQGSAQYGREKGNITLAMLEELGWVGLFLFTGMVVSLSHSILAAVRVASSTEDRIGLFLMLGVVLALVVHAQFEAWLLSPGAGATPVFWALVGIANAIANRVRKEARVRRVQLRNSPQTSPRLGRLAAPSS